MRAVAGQVGLGRPGPVAGNGYRAVMVLASRIDQAVGVDRIDILRIAATGQVGPNGDESRLLLVTQDVQHERGRWEKSQRGNMVDRIGAETQTNGETDLSTKRILLNDAVAGMRHPERKTGFSATRLLSGKENEIQNHDRKI